MPLIRDKGDIASFPANNQGLPAERLYVRDHAYQIIDVVSIYRAAVHLTATAQSA